MFHGYLQRTGKLYGWRFPVMGMFTFLISNPSGRFLDAADLMAHFKVLVSKYVSLSLTRETTLRLDR